MRLLCLTLALSTCVLVGRLNCQSTKQSPAGAERILEESPAVWFEAYYTTLQVTPDERRALYSTPWTGDRRLIDLRTKSVSNPLSSSDLTDVQAVVLGPRGTMAMLGSSGDEPSWHVKKKGGRLERLQLPADARQLMWSPDGQQIAFVRRSVDDSVFLGEVNRPQGYGVGGVAIGLAWLPDGSGVLVLSLDPRGSSTLWRLEPRSGRMVAVARDLDAPTFTSPLAAAPDGRRVYLALAGPKAPDPETRHLPQAQRQLGIYEVDLATGARRVVVPPSPGTDAFTPAVAGGHLYWVQATTQSSIVVLPAAGGEAHVVANAAMIPSWRPDGRQIGFVYGEWRWADWALNWDGAVVNVNATGVPVGRPEPLIVGYHEDFQPVWSPRGRWVAFHSHRTRTAVAAYSGQTQTDDIWLRRVGAPPRDSTEIRVTDFGGESNSPDWSPDGTRFVFTSYAPDGPPGVLYPYIVTIDTVTGKALRHERLPLPKGVANAAWVAWSPVSDEVAIETDLGKGRQALWVVSSTGSRQRKIVDYPLGTLGGVSWTPDGRTLVYAALAGSRMQLFAIPAEGGTPRQLTHDSSNLFTPRVSPDGQLIAATRITHLKEVWRMRLPE